jgi:phage major head subunit gpT-like protein
MPITPNNIGVFITVANTRIGQVWVEIDAAQTEASWTSEDSEMQTSGASQMTFAWTGLMPKPRPWFGSRVMYEPAAQTYTVAPIPYELTYTIDQFKLDDSAANTESYFWRMLPDMLRSWRRHKSYEVRDLLENSGVQTGTRQNGMDGLTFFNASHPIDFYNPGFNPGGMFTAGTYVNDFVGGVPVGGVTVGGPLSVLSFASVLQYGSMIPGEDGEVLGVRYDKLMVPETLKDVGLFILKSTSIAPPTYGSWVASSTQVGAVTNMWAQMGVDLVVNSFLKSTTKHYYWDTKYSIRPVQWLIRESPRIVPRTNPNDPIVFDQHRILLGGWCRDAPAWGPSFLGARSG